MFYRLISYAFLTVAVLSCSADSLPDDPRNSIEVNSAGTKISISGTTFSQWNTFALFVCQHEDQENNPDNLTFTEHNMGYNNVRVTKSETGWTFYNNVLKQELPDLYLSSDEEGHRADVYAYAPYISDVAAPDSICFTVNDNNDLMYVEENLSKTVNKNLEPGTEADRYLSLTFKHVLARLRIGLKIRNVSPISVHSVDSIVVRKAGAKSTALYKTGVFNALTGQLTAESESDSVSVKKFFARASGTGGSFNSNEYKYFDVLLYPVEYMADGDYELVLVIDGFRKTFPLDRADVIHVDGVTYGFRGGSSYTFRFTVDNYIHMDGVEIKTDWDEEDLSDEI